MRDCPEHDLSERLRRTESLLQALVENTHSAVFVKDRQGRYILVNRRCEELWQLTRDKILGRTDSELLDPVDARTVRQHDEEVMHGGEPQEYEEAVDFPDGRHHFLASKVPLLNHDEEVEGLCGIATEVTQLKRVEEALWEETRLLDTLNRVGGILAGELDLGALLQTITDAATQVSGAALGDLCYFSRSNDESPRFFHSPAHTEEELADPESVAYVLSDLLHRLSKRKLPRSWRVDDLPSFASAAGAGGEGDDLLSVITELGRTGRLPGVRSLMVVSLRTRTGEQVGALLCAHQRPAVFTEKAERLVASIASQAAVAIDNARLYAEAQREIAERSRAEEALKEADRRKDAFLAALGHELRNPLAPLRNCLEVMKLAGVRSTDLGGPDLLERMDRQVAQLTHLVDDLLDVARLSRGRILLRRSTLSLTDLVRDAVGDYGTVLREKGLSVTFQGPDDHPLWVHGDRTRLVQCVGNLLHNAGKFTPSGGRVAVSVSESDDGREALVRVSDSGVGMDPESLSQAFEMFSSSTPGHDASQPGMGLGLALVEGLLDMHGGGIEARSEGVGQGSTFVIRLPLVEAPARSGTLTEKPRGTDPSEADTKSVPTLGPTDSTRLRQVEPRPLPADTPGAGALGFEAPRGAMSHPERPASEDWGILSEQQERDGGGEAEAEDEAPAGGARVLIIEDNVDAALSLQLLLEMKGYEVHTAEEGEAGVALARKVRPHVVLCDIGLPGRLNGHGVARALRDSEEARSAYLIALTGFSMEEDRRQALEAGFDHHLAKPIEMQVLDDLLDRVTGQG